MINTVLYSDEFNSITEEKLNVLTPRERKVVEMRLGILGNKKNTYREIGLHFDRSSSCVRQIAEKSFRKMRHSKFNKPEEIPLFEKSFSSNLMITARLANCLAAEGIYCLRNLKCKKFISAEELERFLLKIPNFGRKSYREFIQFLKDNKLSSNDFILNKEEAREEALKEEMKSIKKDINDIKSILNSHWRSLKEFEKFKSVDNGINEQCRHDIQTFKNEMGYLSQQIQRSINQKILEFNEYMAVERHRLDQLLSNIKLTG